MNICHKCATSIEKNEMIVAFNSPETGASLKFILCQNCFGLLYGWLKDNPLNNNLEEQRKRVFESSKSRTKHIDREQILKVFDRVK